MVLDNYKPLFIVIDSGDGSGKDTQCKMIASYLKSKGASSIRVRSHPANDNRFGLRAKRALEQGGRKGHLTAALFYTIDVIRSLILFYRHNDEVLIFSRYLLGVCYLPSSLVLFGYNFFSTFLPRSDFQFYLKVTPENARKRIKTRGVKEEMFERLPKLQKKWLIIDGNPPPDEVWSQIKHELDTILF
jgi:dTMP kinase